MYDIQFYYTIFPLKFHWVNGKVTYFYDFKGDNAETNSNRSVFARHSPKLFRNHSTYFIVNKVQYFHLQTSYYVI